VYAPTCNAVIAIPQSANPNISEAVEIAPPGA
jgi:hypothetical protein